MNLERVRNALQRIGTSAWWVTCAVLPVAGPWVPVPLAVSVAALLLSRLGRPLVLDRPLLWPLGIFYALHLLGMLWSEDLAFGSFDLQIKAGLVLLPLAAACLPGSREAALRNSAIAFAVGTVLAIVLSLWKAADCWMEKGWIECFTQSYLSYDLHPSYSAWFTVWILWYWGAELIAGRVEGRLRIAALAFVPLALGFAVMLASKSGIAGLLVVLVALLILLLRKVRGPRRWTILAVVAALVAIPAVLLAPVFKARFGAALNAVKGAWNGSDDIYTSSEGNEERLVAWQCSWELLQGHALGAGTGDVKEALVGCYRAHGATTAADRRLNSHDQFLQGGAALGWPGLLATLLVAVVPLVLAWRRRDPHLLVFAVLFLLNALVESVLEVQAGVVFFGLFVGLLAQRRSSPA